MDTKKGKAHKFILNSVTFFFSFSSCFRHYSFRKSVKPIIKIYRTKCVHNKKFISTVFLMLKK